MEVECFVEEFKTLKAESVLKRFVSQGGEVQSEELVTAMNICERKVRSLDDILDDSKMKSECVTAEEWVALGNKKVNNKKGTELSKTRNTPRNISIDKVKSLLLKLQQKFSQYKTNGYRNMWIVKPAKLSRGRGIKIFNNLKDIIDYSKTTSCVVQKYIENPMLIKGRKFDIRQWVLVTSFCPLIIWFCKECYIRFGAENYEIEDIGNKYMHLTNNCITKHHQEGEIKENMWEQCDLEEYLKVVLCLFF
jgi:tubulin monoglycylase TTLL3/8